MEKAIAGFRRSNDRSDQALPRSRHLLGEPPVSQLELEQIVREYRRVHEEQRRAKPRSRAERKLDVRRQDLRRRFERLLAEAPLSEADRQRWQSRLLRDGAAAPRTTDVRPPLFCGRSDSGSELRLVASHGGTLDALIDGVAVAVLDDAPELTRTTPGLVFALNGRRFHETFGASPPSLTDLRNSEETGRRPWPRHIRELIADGLVDRDLGLTPRGRRALGLDRLPIQQVEVGAEPSISVRGPLPSRARENLARVLVHVARTAPQPVLRITASLTRHADPALARPIVAKATLDVNGRAVRAHVAAASVSEAIHLLEGRLQRNLRALAERDVGERREGQAPEPGEWHHGDRPPPRPSTVPRPAAERRLVRRKHFAGLPMTPQAAVTEMQLLDHDFHVFVDEASRGDALLYTRPDGALAIRRRNGNSSDVSPFVLDTAPVPTIAVDRAIEQLNVSSDPFVFFVDASSGRGAVLYRRYDGDYGLISADTHAGLASLDGVKR